MNRIRIAPSLLSADFARLGEEVTSVIAAGADLIHFDVMDNHYVPNLTMGPMVCEAIGPYCKRGEGSVPIDVHLMVKPVDALIPMFAKAGASIISFHPEASEHVDRTVQLIRSFGLKAGLVLNPATPLDWLDHTLDQLDLVLLMSVNPGFGGQSFIESVLPKIEAVRRRIDAGKREIWLEVDGGVNAGNVQRVAAAGADTLVAGSAVFGAPDHRRAIAALRDGAETGATMNRFDVIAFDLDGTLVDSAGGVAYALNAALAEEGLPACAPALVKTWIGDGPDATIARALASLGRKARANAELAPRIRRRFDAATLRSPMEGSSVYDGIGDAVRQLASLRPLVVVTNKPTRLSEAVLREAELLPFFAAVHGGDEPSERKPAPTLLRRAAAGVGAAPERLLMVGDGSVDIAAALAAGAAAAWAGWGYGSLPAEAPASVWRLASPNELLLRLALPVRADA